MSCLGFDEIKSKLQTRIDAHKRFAAFDLNEWLLENIAINEGDRVVDLGCGDGNHLGIWSKLVGAGGRVFGLDKSVDLLLEAQRKTYPWPNVHLMWADLDFELPLKPNSINSVIACFSIYYVQSADTVMRRIETILSLDSIVVLVGPTRNNARELYDFNLRATGVRINPRALARTSCLQDEFLPLLRSMFLDVKTTILENKLVFPTVQDFVEYYVSTALFEESRGTREISYDHLINMARQISELVINKETIVIEARKPSRYKRRV